MDTHVGFPRAQRSWWRNVKEFLRYPISELEEKHPLPGERRSLSHVRVTLRLFSVGYLLHWPTPDAGWPIITLGAVIALGMVARDFVEKVPISEGLAALTAWAQRATVARTAQIVDAAEVAVGKIEDAAAGTDPRTPEDGAITP